VSDTWTSPLRTGRRRADPSTIPSPTRLEPARRVVKISVAVVPAVAVTQWIVLDEEDRIVDVSENAVDVFGPLKGESLWETFPRAGEVFAPYCERARRTGEVVELVKFFEGTLKHVRYSPEGSRVTAIWENLASVDVSSVESLRHSLLEIADMLADTDVESGLQPPSLRVLEGGAA
jgi:hypothetical protein